MNKFQRILWSINGVIILIVFLFMGFFFLMEFLRSFRSYHEPEIIVGEALEQAKEKGLILQGLEYDSPVPVYGSTKYILPVRIRTYENPKERGSIGTNFDTKGSQNVDYYNTVNIIFLNSDLSLNHTLLDKKAFIASFQYPSSDYSPNSSDTLGHCITYLIGFEDSNKDGVINEDDNADLFISTVDGTGLTQVTKDMEILNYSFLDTNNILISFHTRDSAPEEHKTKYFATYAIKDNKLTRLTQLDAVLKKIENILVK